MRSPWQVINQVVQYALSEVSLADLVNLAFTSQHAPLLTINDLATVDAEQSPVLEAN